MAARFVVPVDATLAEFTIVAIGANCLFGLLRDIDSHSIVQFCPTCWQNELFGAVAATNCCFCHKESVTGNVTGRHKRIGISEEYKVHVSSAVGQSACLVLVMIRLLKRPSHQ